MPEADVAVTLSLCVVAVLVAGVWWNRRSFKRAEAKLVHRDRLYSMLSHCNQAIVHAGDVDALLPEICRISCTEGDFRLAWIGWHETSNGRVKALARYGEAAYLEWFGEHVLEMGHVRGASAGAGAGTSPDPVS
ncbi:MAG TPA: hypothetical protein VGO53_15345, partial [Steroidobacteraceae bacterium]|nr:hypothetical protein [Steroidobacteraceae bacterium]